MNARIIQKSFEGPHISIRRDRSPMKFMSSRVFFIEDTRSKVTFSTGSVIPSEEGEFSNAFNVYNESASAGKSAKSQLRGEKGCSCSEGNIRVGDAR